MGEIVVGIDGSEGAAQSLRWAVAEADRRGWSVTAVLAWGLLDQTHADGADGFNPDYDGAAAEVALVAIVDRVVGAEVAGRITYKAVNDLPARALLEASADADMV